MAPERVVVDTNVLISGLLSRTSAPAQVVAHVLTHAQLLVSMPTLRELVATLGRRKFDPYVSRGDREALIRRLVPLAEIIEIVETIRASRDPDDDRVLDVAVNGGATTIVTGDHDLLVLHPFRGIAIVTARDYLLRKR
jgi:uncharacterized protein